MYVYENEFNSFFNKNLKETFKRVRDLEDQSIHNWCFGGFKTIAFCKPENLVLKILTQTLDSFWYETEWIKKQIFKAKEDAIHM